MFTETRFGRSNRRQEILAKTLFGAMALAMIVPLVLIVGYLVKEAWPLLSLDFLFTNPTGGMRHGGIWSALIGTLYLVTLSLAPILILGYTPPWAARQVVRYDVAITLYDVEIARAFDRAAREMNATLTAHVKIDTGMGRLGFDTDAAPDALMRLRAEGAMVLASTP